MGAKCIMCRGKVKGFKCDVCGFESDLHDALHEHQGHQVSKCEECQEPETKCNCDVK